MKKRQRFSNRFLLSNINLDQLLGTKKRFDLNILVSTYKLLFLFLLELHIIRFPRIDIINPLSQIPSFVLFYFHKITYHVLSLI